MLVTTLMLAISALVFAGGAWLMFTSLRPQPGLDTYCVKCGCNLTDREVEPAAADERGVAFGAADFTAVPAGICPKCRRLLSPQQKVTCSRSAIAPGRLVVGLMIVIAAATLAVRALGVHPS